MPRLAARAERQKLARTLDTDESELEFLDDRTAPELRALREGISEAMFKRHASSFRLLANLSGLVPAGITAKISHLALGAYLSGRVTGEMPPTRAVAVARKLPSEFLADISLSIDPARAEAVIAAMPTNMVETVAQILVQRREYVTMGRFVGAVSEEALFQVIDLLGDEALLHIGFYVEDAARLDSILEYLSDERLRGIVQTATEQDLWPEALSLVQLVGDAQKGRLGDLVAAEDESVLDSLVHVAQEQALWPEVMVAAGSMTEANQRIVVNLPSVTDEDVLNAIIATAHEQSMWPTILPMVALMSPDSQATAIGAALSQEDAVLRSWLDAAGEADLMPHALTVFGNLPADLRGRVFEQLRKQAGEEDGGKLAGLVAALDTANGR